MSGGHAERAHAKLSASGSSRWLACTGSVELEQMFPDSTSEFAEEGTAAHELSELLISRKMLICDSKKRSKLDKALDKAKKGKHFNAEMETSIGDYVDFVGERFLAAKARSKDAVILLEHRLDFSEWVPDGFGTGDVVLISDGVLEVIDLKYGKGVPVSAENNSQMRLYGLGALNEFDMLYGIEKVLMTIIQPRLDNISTEELTVDELLEWAEQVVRPKAQEAVSGAGTFLAGSHCRFCKARTHCRTRAEANLELARHEFQDPALLSVDEIAEVLGKVDELVKWAGEIKGYALEQAEKHGVKFPNWKLVEGRSNRVLTDKDAVADTLILEGFEEDVIYKPRDLKGITDLEKLLGKKQFEELLSDLVVKPAGKPTLVPESDKRPELSSVASAVADFADDL